MREMKGNLHKIGMDKSNAAKALKTSQFPRVAKAAKTASRVSSAGIGAVAAAGAYGAYRIRKASKAANKEIGGQHSTARNVRHDRLIKSMHAQSVRKQAAKKLRTAKPKKKIIPKRTWVGGGQGDKGFDPSKWR